jgi:PHP domain-containing protein
VRFPRNLLAAGIGPAFLVALSLHVGCTAPHKLRSLQSDIESVQRTQKRSAADPDWIPLRCAIHVHSRFSHDSKGRIEDIAKAARDHGIDAVFLTDHSNPRSFVDGPHGDVGGVHFVRGEEISVRSGSLLALGTSATIGDVKKPAQEVVDEIQAQGGVCCVSHIESTNPFAITGYDLIGIHNLHADAKRIPVYRFPLLFIDALRFRRSYPRELLLEEVIRPPSWQLAKWDSLLETRRVAAISEIDAHANLKVLGVSLDPYELILGVEHTYVLVPPNWDEDDLLDALRAGRTYVGFTMLADPRGFSFAAEKDGNREGTIGDEIRFEPGLQLCAKCPGEGRIVIVANGKRIASTKGRELRVPCSEPGAYRAEVWVRVGGRDLACILASPIYVRGEI